MIKLLFTFLIVYFAYKVMFKPKELKGPFNNNRVGSDKKEDEEDFVDYEEVD